MDSAGDNIILNRLLVGIQQLKALIGAVSLQVSGIGAASLPTVDFCCDMFDRQDESALAGYWSDTTGLWTLRSNMAIYQGTEASLLSASLTSGASTVNLSALGAETYTLNTASASGAYTNSASGSYRANLYSAKMSSADFRVKIGFNIIPPVVTSVTTTTTGASGAGTQTTNNTVNSALAFAANIGIAVGSRTIGRTLGIAFQGTPVPSVTLPGGSGSAVAFSVGSPGPSSSISVPGATLAAGSAAASQFGMLATSFTGAPVAMASTVRTDTTTFTATSVPTFSSTPYPYLTASMSANTGVAAAATLSPVVGANTLEMIMQGNVYEVYLNGALWYTATRAVMTDRAQPGLLNYAVNMLGYMDLNNRSLWGITSFKAWPIGQGEPPDQTGRGIYVDGNGTPNFLGGNLIYSDKYHTNVYGNPNTPIPTSVTYNPLA